MLDTHLCVLLTQLDTSGQVAMHKVPQKLLSPGVSLHQHLNILAFLSLPFRSSLLREKEDCDEYCSDLSTTLISIHHDTIKSRQIKSNGYNGGGGKRQKEKRNGIVAEMLDKVLVQLIPVLKFVIRFSLRKILDIIDANSI